ncbi:MAG: type II secretion system F family protein, partial [Pirellula sp.]
ESRASMRESLIRMLAIAHRERLDVAPLVENLAREHAGIYGQQLRQLATRLREGTPLVASLEQTPEALSDDQVLAIRFATQTGTLSETYQQLLTTGQSTPEDENGLRGMSAYWTVLGLAILGVTAYLVLRTLPMFRSISREFGMELPTTLRMFTRLLDVLWNELFYIAIAACCVGYILYSPRARRIIRKWFAAVFVQPIARASLTPVMRLLAVALNAGRPVSSSLSALAKYHHHKDVRQRLLLARNEIEQGVDEWQSLADAGLLTREESLSIAMLPDKSSRAWFLQTLSDEKDFASHRRKSIALAMVHPAIMLTFGAVVLFISVAFFGFNIHLIDVLS